jgi:hypothetical protein
VLSSETLKNYANYLRVDGKMILKWILKTLGERMWLERFWYRMRSRKSYFGKSLIKPGDYEIIKNYSGIDVMQPVRMCVALRDDQLAGISVSGVSKGICKMLFPKINNILHSLNRCSTN